ncbi:hypothetical protein MKX01_001050 [Papaver californicum]|nr:hypothetical protein MKX01_001050 [Papaver californicum]
MKLGQIFKIRANLHEYESSYILSVKEDADYEDIRRGYKSAVLNSHPDKIQATTKTYIQHESQDISNDTKTYDDVSLEEMMVEELCEVLELFYKCRCGDCFSIDAIELGEMGYSLGRDESKIFVRRPDLLPVSAEDAAAMGGVGRGGGQKSGRTQRKHFKQTRENV